MSSASAVVLSNNLLFRAERDNIPISPMKLQKLLYYVCVKYAKETGTLPISEQFEVWETGPVLASVHSAFQPFGSRPISACAANAKGQTKVVDEECNPILSRCLDYIWAKMKDYSTMTLAKRTHQKGSGWYSAYQEGQETIRLDEMIADTSL